MRAMTEPGLLVVVVTHTAPATLHAVLEALTAQAPAGCTAVLFTGAAASPAALRAQQAARDAGSKLLTVSAAVSIGAARAWLLDHLQRSASCWRSVAFLDDDCLPRPGWWTAARRASQSAALAFGPRYPAVVCGAGARVRAWEAAGSAKLRAATLHQDRLVREPRMLVAGGNMLLDVATAHRLGVTDVAFADSAFEDVDYQLRIRAAGEHTLFDPEMAVDHHDRLSGPALLRKSVLSGKGLARCAARHGRNLWWCCRWRPARVLIRTLWQTLPLSRRQAPDRKVRLLAVARAAVVCLAYTSERLRDVLPRRTGRSGLDTPMMRGGGSRRGELTVSALTPPQEARRVLR